MMKTMESRALITAKSSRLAGCRLSHDRRVRVSGGHLRWIGWMAKTLAYHVVGLLCLLGVSSLNAQEVRVMHWNVKKGLCD